MKATINGKQNQNGKNLSRDKELVDRFQVVTFVESADRPDDMITTPIDARFWMGKSRNAQMVCCTVWINAKDRSSCAGHGYAGGYGYHKLSAGLQAALESAGVSLERPIDECGESAMREALLAVATAAGWDHAATRVLS